MDKKINIRLLILTVLLLFVWTAMLMVDVSEWYALSVYPSIYRMLSRFSSLFPFSVGDCFIYGSIIGLIIYLTYTIVKGKGFWRRIRRIIENLAWVYVWFYMAWGLNYFRHDFYTEKYWHPSSSLPLGFRPMKNSACLFSISSKARCWCHTCTNLSCSAPPPSY